MAIILDGTSGITATGALTGLTTPITVGQGGSGGLVGGVEPIQPITASVATSALTCTLNPTILNFRATPLTSGTINTVSIASAISVTVPSGTLMATVSAQQSRLVLIALYNGGTPVLGITSTVGGENLDETTLLTTTPIAQTCTFTGAIAVTTGILTLSATGTGTFALGQSLAGTGVPSGTYVKALLTGTLGAAASTYSTNITTTVASTTLTGTAGTGVYSTAAVTASPFRVVGYIESTQATAGTWATAPSTIQGEGGQALAAMSSLGYGQTWQSFTSVTRPFGTVQYNTTGKPIMVNVSGHGSPSNGEIIGFVNSVCIGYSGTGSLASGDVLSNLSFIVPHGSSYHVDNVIGASFQTWSELR